MLQEEKIQIEVEKNRNNKYMSLCHPWYFEMSCQWCKLFSNASENVIWAKITDKNSSHRKRHKKQSDLEKFEGLKEKVRAKPWGKSAAPWAMYGSGWWQHQKLYKYGGSWRNRPQMNKTPTGPVGNKHTPIRGCICSSGKNPGLGKGSPICTNSVMA